MNDRCFGYQRIPIGRGKFDPLPTDSFCNLFRKCELWLHMVSQKDLMSLPRELQGDMPPDKTATSNDQMVSAQVFSPFRLVCSLPAFTGP